jgi:hypothetical protein
MAGHESAGLEAREQAGVSIWLDIQSRDLVESDRFGRYDNSPGLALPWAYEW